MITLKLNSIEKFNKISIKACPKTRNLSRDDVRKAWEGSMGELVLLPFREASSLMITLRITLISC